MKLRFHHLIKLAFFWLIFFVFFRIIFILCYYEKIQDASLSTIFYIIFTGYRLDLSIISYLICIPYLLWSIQQFFKNRTIHKIHHLYNVFFIFLAVVLSIANIRLYKEWGTLLNYRAFGYLSYPKEVMASVSLLSIIVMALICILISVAAVLLYKKLSINFSYVYEKLLIKFIMIISFGSVLVIGARGGVQQIPINESVAYHSNHQINNHIATNNIWYLIHSFLDANEEKNPYYFMDTTEAQKKVKNLFYESTNQTEKILNTDKPNIVFIVLESWTADLVKALGGEENVTPNFDLLRKEGLLFTNAYTSGYRTDQGLVCIFSGFPAQPNTSIMTVPGKAEKLKSIVSYFDTNGYKSSFYYGGEIGFANMKTYLINSGFERLIDKNSFQPDQLGSKWGAYDEYIFEKQLSDLRNEKEPFFSSILTLSTHEPFDVPLKETPFNGTEEPEQFKKAAYYTDYCLGNYFTAAKKEKWFSNTLFILVADHGHHHPKNRDMNMPESRKITLLFYGDVIKKEYKDKTMDKIIAQNDIPGILLGQLNADYKDFKWSKNIFNESARQFAYYSNENVLGWITPEGVTVYSFASGEVTLNPTGKNTATADSLSSDSKAFLQNLYQQYLEY